MVLRRIAGSSFWRTGMSASANWDAVASALTSPQYHLAQHRVLRQLIEALLFEQVLDYDVLENGPGGVCFHIPGRCLDGSVVHFRCCGYISDSFGRIRLDSSSVLRISPEGTRPADSVQQFLLETLDTTGIDETLLTRFIREIQQTLLKDTLARHQRRQDGPDRDLTALEGQLQDGHPYHPCYKSRIGFDTVDNFAYGPEFQPSVRLVWLAIRSECASLVTCRDINFQVLLGEELGAAQHEHFVTKLRTLGLEPEKYLVLPAHPWQWREKIVPDLFPMLQCQDMVWLGEGEDSYRPLQSIRSLANDSRPAALQVKLPIGIVNTSADRILSCHNVVNAPAVSDWLCDILQQDAALRDSGLVFLREVAGITYRDLKLPLTMQAQQYGMLGAVWRESINGYLQPGESAAPFSGLCQCEADGRPFIAPWVERHGLDPWLKALLQAAIPPLIHLLYAHGIGMEAHAQNIVLIHRQGLPSRIALKDLPGGLRFVREFLANPDLCPELAPTPSFRKQANASAGMVVTNPAEVRDYFHDAVFFINFGELSLFLRQHYNLEETEFWARVAECIYAYQAQHPELAARFACFDLFAPGIFVEQLAKRRLFAETEARLQLVANPLHRHRQGIVKEAA